MCGGIVSTGPGDAFRQGTNVIIYGDVSSNPALRDIKKSCDGWLEIVNNTDDMFDQLVDGVYYISAWKDLILNGPTAVLKGKE